MRSWKRIPWCTTPSKGSGTNNDTGGLSSCRGIARLVKILCEVVFMRSVRTAALLVGLVLVWSVLLWAETAEITTWTIPTAGSLPEGVAIAEDGTIYFTEYMGQKIGRLDPATNRIQERSIIGNPKDLAVVGNNSVYYSLPVAAGIGLLVFDGGGNFWELPGGSVDSLVQADSGPGACCPNMLI